MSTSTVTSKGQITIPVEIRNALNIHAGDILEFVIEQDGKINIFAQTKDVQDLKTLLPRPKKKVSIEEMNAVIAKRGRGSEE
ncbi:MAG: AbrB/MazE/SpoVT family DNA-binding domain-containing protein [Gammaproteobacteria bacterium]